MSFRAGTRGRGRQVGGVILLAALAWAGLVHHGLGPVPDPERPVPWHAPRGFLVAPLAGTSLAPVVEDPRAAVLAFCLPAVLLVAASFVLSRSALVRTLTTGLAVASGLFAWYGIAAPLVWRFFHWRWSVSMLLFALLAAGACLAPLLARSWAGQPAWLRLASYLPVAAALVVLERNVTGTDPTLPFAISPWPVLQVFGLESVAFAAAALILGAALGLAAAGRRGGAVRVAAAALAAAVPALALALGGRLEVLPFAVDGRLLAGIGLLGAALFVAAGSLGRGPAEPRRRRRVRSFAGAAALLGLPLVLGLALARLDYSVTREERAARVIDALSRYYAREETYPDSLEELAQRGDLPEVPLPRIGFALLQSPAFVYQSFGTSYLLEFAAPRWVQCAYNPPFAEDEEDEDSAPQGGDEDLGGAWSCPSKPPELW
jgi:hypothetical protein